MKYKNRKIKIYRQILKEILTFSFFHRVYFFLGDEITSGLCPVNCHLHPSSSSIAFASFDNLHHSLLPIASISTRLRALTLIIVLTTTRLTRLYHCPHSRALAIILIHMPSSLSLLVDLCLDFIIVLPYTPSSSSSPMCPHSCHLSRHLHVGHLCLVFSSSLHEGASTKLVLGAEDE